MPTTAAEPPGPAGRPVRSQETITLVTLVGVGALSRPEYLIEVDAFAVA